MGSKLTKQKKNSISAINENQISNSLNNFNNESISTNNSLNQYEATNSSSEDGLLNLDEFKLNKANQETDDASIREKSSLSSSVDEHYVFSDIMAKSDGHSTSNDTTINMKKDTNMNENETKSANRGESVFVKPLTSILVNTSTQNVPKIPNSIRGRVISVPNKYSKSSSQLNSDCLNECKAKSKGVRFSEQVRVIHDDLIISNVMCENGVKAEKNCEVNENNRRMLMSNGKEFDRFKSWNFFKESNFLVIEKKSINT
jgi:hypothetical protein